MWRHGSMLVLVIQLLAGCAGPNSTSVPLKSPTPEATPTAIPTPTSTPRPMPTSPAISQPTPTPTIEPAATHVVENTCTHSQAVYSVAYPADWYSNVPTQSYPECTAFGPEPFGDAVTDPTVAITMLAEPDMGWNNPLGPLTAESEGYRLLVDAGATVGGRPAWVREFELTSPDERAGELMVSYSVMLESGWFVTATSIAPPEKYPDYKAVLVAMLAGLRVPG